MGSPTKDRWWLNGDYAILWPEHETGGFTPIILAATCEHTLASDRMGWSADFRATRRFDDA
jgi:hypothetical protein